MRETHIGLEGKKNFVLVVSLIDTPGKEIMGKHLSKQGNDKLRIAVEIKELSGSCKSDRDADHPK